MSCRFPKQITSCHPTTPHRATKLSIPTLQGRRSPSPPVSVGGTGLWYQMRLDTTVELGLASELCSPIAHAPPSTEGGMPGLVPRKISGRLQQRDNAASGG
jgi:hypothetical protein